MKFKESKLLIESHLNQSNHLLISMDGEIFYSLLKKGENKKDRDSGREWEILQESFIPFFGDDVYDKNDNPGDDYLLIDKKSWNHFLSLI